MTVVASGNFQELLEPKLRQVFFETYEEVPEQYSRVFKSHTSKKAKETDFHVAGTGMWKKKESKGSVHYSEINPADEVTYTHEEYSDGIQVERKMADDEQYDVINKLPQSLARGGRALVETTAADVLNDGDTEVGYDGKPLFADDHPLRGNTTNVVSNKLTDVLDADGLKAAMLLMRGQLDQAGLKIQARGNLVTVPPDLEFTIMEILNSQLEPFTADNTANVLKGKGIRHEVLDYLEKEDAWFLFDTRLYELNFFWRVKPEFKGEENFDTMIAKYRGYLRFSVGYSDWRGSVGSFPE